MADEIQKILSIIFVNKIKLNISSIITVSRVKVTSDLKLAKIYISIFNKEIEQEKIEKNKKTFPKIDNFDKINEIAYENDSIL